MRKAITFICVVLLIFSAVGICNAETVIDDMTRAERNELLIKILQLNADEMRGSNGSIRPFSSISRDNPVLCGETARFGLTKAGFDLDVTLKSIVYGDEAFAITEDANSLNADPKDGEEYMIATFVVEARKDGDDRISVKKSDFDIVSRNGAVYKNSTFTVGIPDEVELFGGGIDELQIVHIIDKGDVPFALLFGGIWFDLTPIAE